MADYFLARLPMGEDLLAAIKTEFKNRSIAKAGFSVIGAVTHAVMGFYDQVARQYRQRAFEGEFEIVACVGNVSLKDGETFVHAHIVLSGQDYACIGGHLMAGTRIFAAELCGNPIPGGPLVRQFDEPTGLALWTPGSSD